MINLYPCDFSWPQTQTQDAQSFQFGDYQVQQIIDMIINQMQVGQQVQIYADQQRTQLLEGQYQLSQYGINQDCNLFIFLAPPQSQITVLMTIDDLNESSMALDPNCTIQQIIEYCQEQGQVTSSIISMDLQDQNGASLSKDFNVAFSSFPNIFNFQLKLYSQQQQYQQPQQQFPQQQQQQQSLQKSLSINKIDLAKELLKQLIVFPKLSILIDSDGEFVVFKFHYPLAINGFVSKEKAKKQTIDEDSYDFKEQNKIKYALSDEYGLIISWGDSKYSKVRIAQQG